MVDERLTGLLDLNSDPLLPFKRITVEGRIVNSTCAASEVLVLHWENALEIPGDVTDISRIVLQIASPWETEAFVKRLVFGKEYNIWFQPTAESLSITSGSR